LNRHCKIAAEQNEWSSQPYRHAFCFHKNHADVRSAAHSSRYASGLGIYPYLVNNSYILGRYRQKAPNDLLFQKVSAIHGRYYYNIKGHIMNISVLGGGKWGLTLASLLANKYSERKIHVWIRKESKLNNKNKIEYLSNKRIFLFSDVEYKLPENIKFTSDLEECTKKEIVINTIPSQHLKSYFEIFDFNENTNFINAAKGMIDNDLIVSAFRKYFPETNYLFLGGPNIAQEIIRSLKDPEKISPAFAILAANEINDKNKLMLQKLNFHPYYNLKLIKNIEANEWCSIFKQIYAIILGFVSGSEYDSNTISSVFQDCIFEIFNILSGLKYDPKIFIKSKVGLAYLEVTYKYGRNGKFGKSIAEKGLSYTLDKFKNDCVEGIKLIEKVYKICVERSIKAPFLESAYSVLYQNNNLEKMLDNLLQQIELNEDELILDI